MCSTSIASGRSWHAAAPAKEQLRRQLKRVLASQTLETLPATELPPSCRCRTPVQRKRRLPGLKDSRLRARISHARRPSESETEPDQRVGLALGGGSARGFAHVLMLEAFDELGVKPAVIAGTSMGAICRRGLRRGALRGRYTLAELMALLRQPCEVPGALRRQAAWRHFHAMEPARAERHRQCHVVRDAAARGHAMRFRIAQNPAFWRSPPTSTPSSR